MNNRIEMLKHTKITCSRGSFFFSFFFWCVYSCNTDCGRRSVDRQFIRYILYLFVVLLTILSANFCRLFFCLFLYLDFWCVTVSPPPPLSLLRCCCCDCYLLCHCVCCRRQPFRCCVRRHFTVRTSILFLCCVFIISFSLLFQLVVTLKLFSFFLFTLLWYWLYASRS